MLRFQELSSLTESGLGQLLQMLLLVNSDVLIELVVILWFSSIDVVLVGLLGWLNLIWDQIGAESESLLITAATWALLALKYW